MTPLEQLKILESQLVEESVDGEFIDILCKDGKYRRYKIKDYAELCIYTEAIRAQAAATINIAIEYDSDLVQVSKHQTICPVCKPVEGKVFSISGSDPDFPPLDFELPLHPRCKHTLTVIFREIIDKYGVEKYK